MGMFDTVTLKCPHCGADTELQTKAGPCRLKVYSIRRAPLSIAGCLTESGKYTLECCGKQVAFRTQMRTVEVGVIPVLGDEDDD